MKILKLFIIIAVIFSCKNKPTGSIAAEDSFIISENISNQQVLSFAEDKYGVIWIGTDRGLNRYNGHEYVQYFNNEQDSLSICHNRVQALFNDSKGELWIGTPNGICKYDYHNDSFNNIPVIGSYKNVIKIFEDKNNKLYASLRDGLYIFNTEKLQFEKILDYEFRGMPTACVIDNNDHIWEIKRRGVDCYNLEGLKPIKTFELTHDRPVSVLAEYFDNNNTLWVAHSSNIYKFDTEKLEYTYLKNLSATLKSIIVTIKKYDEENLLFDTQRNGLFIYNIKSGEVFSQYDKEFPFEVPFDDASALFIDSRNNLWIGSFTKGFTIHYKLTQFNEHKDISSIVENMPVKSVIADNNGNIWISTGLGKLIVYNPSLKTKNVFTLRDFYTESPYFRETINKMHVDKNGKIWFLSAGRVVRCNYQNQQLIREKTISIPFAVFDIVEDKYGGIWISTSCEHLVYISNDNVDEVIVFAERKDYISYLIALSSNEIMACAPNQNIKLINPQTKQIKEIDISSQIDIKTFIPTTLFQDSKQNVWLGIAGRGLYKLDIVSGLIEHKPGLSCNDICSIIEDKDGNLWIGTLYGLNKYNTSNGKNISYYAYDAIGGNQFSLHSAYVMSENMLIFGGTHGLTVFDPAKINRRENLPVFFEYLRVNNHVVRPGPKNNIKESLINTPEIKLKHDESSFSISYIAIDYSKLPKMRYQYKMEPYDNQWIDAHNNMQSYYSNLPAGNYSFKVRTYNNDNINNETDVGTESVIKIYKQKAIWATDIAIAFYVLLVISFVIYISYLYFKIKENKIKTKLAIKEKEAEAYLNKMSLSFFTNISHEFRTPLTVIYGPVKNLMKKTGLDSETSQQLEIINRNVTRMLRLVNQMLDFNKLENDVLKLNISQTDIVVEINNIIDSFTSNAQEKNITINSIGLNTSLTMPTDRDNIEKIISNIMSNALKFTPVNGIITIKLGLIDFSEAKSQFLINDSAANCQYVQISIENSGSSIPIDKLDKIFERYYQSENQNHGHYNWGTGIGLYFVKRLVDMHLGYIKAQNSELGCIFSFILPLDTYKFEIPDSQLNISDIQNHYIPPSDTQQDEDVYNADILPTILVVDDDVEIASFLKGILSNLYSVIIKYDAESGYNSIEECMPDLIISDILMPGKDGYEFCKMVKSNISYCHIPVILLTAKTMVNEQIQGFDEGASAYVTKPFDPLYLLAVIKSQLKNRDYARNILLKTTDAEAIEENILLPKDKAFIDSLYTFMEKELSNADLNVAKAAGYMKISRSKLFYKIKGLTGENPNSFFKKYRLNRAAELIKKREHTIAEIAELTGFSSPSHFSSSFKKQFNCPPSDYKG